MDGMYGIQKWITNDTVIQILLMRVIGFTDKRIADLTRIRCRQLSYYISRYMYLGWQIYNRHHKLLDYLYFLGNIPDVSRETLKAVITESCYYSTDTAFILLRLQEYISTIPDAYKPSMEGYVYPIFTTKSFYLIWEGLIPAIAL